MGKWVQGYLDNNKDAKLSDAYTQYFKKYYPAQDTQDVQEHSIPETTEQVQTKEDSRAERII